MPNDALATAQPGRRQWHELVRAGARALHPNVASVLLRDWMFPLPRPADSQQHLTETMQWLLRAQDRSQTAGGVSAGWSLLHGWLPAYPETTGYIIPTFLDYAEYSGSEIFRERARRMANWELEIQLPSGAVLGGTYTTRHRKPAVFNTGQVILGLCRAAADLNEEPFLAAARRAGDWLCSVQSDDGSWSLEGVTTGTTVHAYDIRTAWSLLELEALTGVRRYREVASRNAEWTLRQQTGNGWFENNAFFRPPANLSTPLTHTISYVMEGLLECARLLGNPALSDAALKTAARLLKAYEIGRTMPGEFNADWAGNRSFSCLTGDAQIATVWLRLFCQTRDVRFLNAALRLNDHVKATQRLRSFHKGIRGGVKGSHPWYGKYTRFTYVNWGAKFLADSLMFEIRIMKELEASLADGSGKRTVA